MLNFLKPNWQKIIFFILILLVVIFLPVSYAHLQNGNNIYWAFISYYNLWKNNIIMIGFSHYYIYFQIIIVYFLACIADLILRPKKA